MTASSRRPAPAAGRDILAAGRKGLARLPSADQLADQPAAERHAFLDARREELYAVTSVVADRAIRRTVEGRSSFPPYGLVRSLFTQMRVVADDPEPYEQGSIDSFLALGRAGIDTVVYFLEREIVALRASHRSWLLGRLEELLVLYRVDAPAAAQGRIRDPFSYLYGGLHFGTSVCVQMVEVMTRLLDGADQAPRDERAGGAGLTAGGPLTARAKAEVMRRSTRALYQLTAINIEDIPSVYQHLHGPTDGAASGWLDQDHFAVQVEDGRPRRIDIKPGVVVAGENAPLGAGPSGDTEAGAGGALRGDDAQPGAGGAPKGDDAEAAAGGPLRYTTRGCPARGSASGGPGAIAMLWNWCIDRAVETRLINDS